MNKKNLVLTPSIICICIGFILNVINDITFGNGIWKGDKVYLSSNELLHHCEILLDGNFISQPINAWSNIAYLFVGILITQLGIIDLRIKNKTNFVKQFPFFSIMFGGCICYLFLSSFLYHSSLTHWSLKLDISAVNACCLIPFTYALCRTVAYFQKRKVQMFLIKTYGYVISFILILILLLYVLELNTKGLMIFLSLGAGVLLLLNKYYYKSKMNIKFYYISGISLLSSFCFYLMDNFQIYCNEESWFKPHAIWHILTAITLLFIYLYFRSEKGIITS